MKKSIVILFFVLFFTPIPIFCVSEEFCISRTKNEWEFCRLAAFKGVLEARCLSPKGWGLCDLYFRPKTVAAMVFDSSPDPFADRGTIYADWGIEITRNRIKKIGRGDVVLKWLDEGRIDTDIFKPNPIRRAAKGKKELFALEYRDNSGKLGVLLFQVRKRHIDWIEVGLGADLAKEEKK